MNNHNSKNDAAECPQHCYAENVQRTGGKAITKKSISQHKLKFSHLVFLHGQNERSYHGYVVLSIWQCRSPRSEEQLQFLFFIGHLHIRRSTKLL